MRKGLVRQIGRQRQLNEHQQLGSWLDHCGRLGLWVDLGRRLGHPLAKIRAGIRGEKVLPAGRVDLSEVHSRFSRVQDREFVHDERLILGLNRSDRIMVPNRIDGGELLGLLGLQLRKLLKMP